MAVVIPGFLMLKGNPKDPGDILRRKFDEKGPCSSVDPGFIFSGSYVDKVRRFFAGRMRCRIHYRSGKRDVTKDINTEVYLSALIMKERIEARGQDGGVLVPIAVSILVTEEDLSMEDFIAIPHFLAWNNGCPGGNGSSVPFPKMVEERINSKLGEWGRVELNDVGRFFTSVINVSWKRLSEIHPDDPTVRDVIRLCPKELYGMAVTDEGFSAVSKEYALSRLEEWATGNRVYLLKVISPASIMAIKADEGRESFETMELPDCTVWKRYVKAHMEERREICHHGLFYYGEYLGLTFATISAFRHVIRGLSGSLRSDSVKGVEVIKSLIREMDGIRIDIETYLSALYPGRISKIPELTRVIEKMYETRGLPAFWSEMKHTISVLTEVMREGGELIEQRIEKQSARQLEFGVTLLEALPFGYIIHGLSRLIGLSISTELAISITAALFGLWGAYKYRTVGRWEGEQVEKFMKKAEDMISALF
ncbi:MAG: hypothetical protein GXO14_00740 [Thermococci archaeon]|nr:hypothetical protein [Thermococci archaeon]